MTKTIRLLCLFFKCIVGFMNHLRINYTHNEQATLLFVYINMLVCLGFPRNLYFFLLLTTNNIETKNHLNRRIFQKRSFIVISLTKNWNVCFESP